ncbi:MAG: SCP2 sterol-binding domain-containing protein [Deltaproteobacteria bacterium]|nr:SCP2 sterol-binding domain-containing protein [Deltaproteobacteria bacterium]
MPHEENRAPDPVHPSVDPNPRSSSHVALDAEWLKGLCKDSGAADAGLVEIDRPAISDQRGEILATLPSARTLLVLACRLHRENMRTVFHSLTSMEFRHGWDSANRTARSIVAELTARGVRALNIPAGFPFEVERWPGKMWLTSDKVLAEQAGLGRMGWNRLILHPKFGSTVVFGTILLDAESTRYDQPLEVNPCIRCKLCVSVCPVAAISADGHFDFMSCYTHNYRERLGGFADWIERIVASRSVGDYRQRVNDRETMSMWQNLSIGAQTRCDRCVGVCPAGEEVIDEYRKDRKGYTDSFVKRFRQMEEPVYVVPGSDAQAYVKTRFPHKIVRSVSNGIRPNSAKMFLEALPLMFQRNQSDGLNAVFHFTFTGSESCPGTVAIRNRAIEVTEGLVGRPDLSVTADSRTWISFLAKETNLLWALVTRKIRVKGSPRLMAAFAKCFPS